MIGSCTNHPNPDLWFSEFDNEWTAGRPSRAKTAQMVENTIAAINICSSCPVRSECLEEGMKPENLEYGVWGGLMAGERMRLANIRLNFGNRITSVEFADKVNVWRES
jgi:hypothetical protein